MLLTFHGGLWLWEGRCTPTPKKILLQNGSRQKDLWGFNIYPDKPRDQWLEYTSFINIRPRGGNRAIEIQDPNLQLQVKKTVEGLIKND